MGKPKRIDVFFKKKDADFNSKISSSTSNPQASAPEQCPSKMLRIESQIMIQGYLNCVYYNFIYNINEYIMRKKIILSLYFIILISPLLG
jgi:hypothetical protein